jgi:cyclopropane fatty-acyl-phospholipid synthase-like methyltransferase
MKLFIAKDQRGFLYDFVGFSEKSKVLDIGCGPASILNSLDIEIDYTGIDSNSNYILSAQKRFGKMAKFILLDVDDLENTFSEKFDKILILGTIHHLSSVQVQKLLKIAHGLLAENGELITHDPVRSQKQNVISKLLMDLDRGKFIRYEQEHLDFFKPHFEFTSTINGDVMWFPYEIIYVKATPLCST